MKRLMVLAGLVFSLTVGAILYAIIRVDRTWLDVILIAILVLDILFFFRLYVSILSPLEKLRSRIANEMQPQIETTLEEITEKPVSRETGDLIQRLVEERLRKNNAEIFNRQTELTALQSQINPHFLYNTLDTIRGQALVHDAPEVADMIETLSRFFRYSISRRGNEVTLRDELDNIRNYMKILQYRFGDRYLLQINIDKEEEQAYDYYIPRLILQPIVENAITHGLEDMPSGGEIVIDVAVSDELILTVSDNGKGMGVDELHALNERIHEEGVRLQQADEGQTHGTGIALPNVHRRIVLLFGREYGLNVYSTKGRGTDVELTLPIVDRAKPAEPAEGEPVA